MARNKLARLLSLCCLLFPTMSLAQNGGHYTTSVSSVSPSDATSDCAVGKKNCWILVSMLTETFGRCR